MTAVLFGIHVAFGLLMWVGLWMWIGFWGIVLLLIGTAVLGAVGTMLSARMLRG